MFERGKISNCDVLLADSGYDCRGNEQIAIFRPIKKGGCYKSSNKINFFLRLLLLKISGFYGKR